MDKNDIGKFVLRLTVALLMLFHGVSKLRHGGAHTFAIDRQTGALGGELQFFYLFSALAIALLGSGRIAVRSRR